MKKYISLFVAIVLTICSICACGKTNAAATQTTEQTATKSLKIVTTIFPIYDWVKNILGEKFDKNNVEILLDNSVDLHNYQPTSADIVKISNSDLFIYVGGESDKWVPSVLEQVSNKDLKAINLMEYINADLRPEEEKEGMEEEHEEGHDGEEEHKEEYDEHIWLSLKNAKKLVSAISNVLQELDADNKSIYVENTTQYIDKLQILDKEYADATDTDGNKTLIFGDRFPFLYMTKDYGLDYYAAFKGCSAETEASFKTIAFLAQKLDEYNLDYIFTIEGTNHKIAETIIENSNNKDRKILTLNSMQSTTTKDIESGSNYIGIMQNNLDVLKQALNK